jgi:hypothetical protein
MMSSNLSHPQDAARDGSLEAKYANYFQVGHNAYEFIVDYGQSYGETVATIHTRIIMAPTYARELLKILQQALGEYEVQFGTIGKQDS